MGITRDGMVRELFCDGCGKSYGVVHVSAVSRLVAQAVREEDWKLVEEALPPGHYCESCEPDVAETEKGPVAQALLRYRAARAARASRIR